MIKLSINENEGLSVDKVARMLCDPQTAKYCGFSLDSFTDDQLAELWSLCIMGPKNDFCGQSYDDEVYDEIARRPNSKEIFAKAEELWYTYPENKAFADEQKRKKGMKESYPTDTLYCVAYYDEDNDEYVGDAYDGVTLAAFDTLGNAESFEAWANQRKEEVDAFLASDDDYDDYDDEDYDYSPDEITVDELEEWLAENTCVGCYHVSAREALKARQHEMILDGQTVFILNQKDIGSDRLLSVDATPDRYER